MQRGARGLLFLLPVSTTLAAVSRDPSACAAAAAAAVPRVAELPPSPFLSTPHAMHRVVFSKYWSYDAEGRTSSEGSTYYLFLPSSRARAANAAGDLPVVVEFHGGGFTGGSATSEQTAAIDGFLQAGVAYASMDYRLVATKYYYGAGAAVCEEEFIHADSTGRLWLDASGMVASDYKVRVGRQEFNTKCSFDAAAGFEDLLSRASTFGLDVHRVGFTGSSAGGGEMHYLSWAYRALDRNWRRYTPVAMVYTMAQLDYPVQNILDRVWGLWADDVGNETLLTSILAQTREDCEMCVGNPWCGASGATAQTALCNATWHAATMARYCGADGGRMAGVTLGELRRTQVWPTETEHDRGLARMWYASENMVAARAVPEIGATPFYLYVFNQLNGTAGMHVVHSALYARQYARVAETARLEFVSYYPDYQGMSAADRGDVRLRPAPGVELNLRTSTALRGWRALAGVSATQPGGAAEQRLFFCHAFNISIVV